MTQPNENAILWQNTNKLAEIALNTRGIAATNEALVATLKIIESKVGKAGSNPLAPNGITG